jgi:hypothetical protein
MCLRITNSTIVPDRRRAWKVVKTLGDKMFSPIMGCHVYQYDEWSVSDRIGKQIADDEHAYGVNHGIHVYTDWFSAYNSLAMSYPDHEVIELEVDPKDWVADGNADQAVYMKVKPVKD